MRYLLFNKYRLDLSVPQEEIKEIVASPISPPSIPEDQNDTIDVNIDNYIEKKEAEEKQRAKKNNNNNNTIQKIPSLQHVTSDSDWFSIPSIEDAPPSSSIQKLMVN